MISPQLADEYASWFRSLANGTRLQILSVVAAAEDPMTVGEIVDLVDKSQSTVSKHLEILAGDGFVIAEPDGVKTMIKVNELCMTDLPEAARVIMGVEE